MKQEVQRKLKVAVAQQRLIHGSRLLEEAMATEAHTSIGKWLCLTGGHDMSLELLLIVRSPAAVRELEVVKKHGLALESAAAELKGDREVVMEAVRQNGLALQHASEELRNDRAVALEAVRKNGFALKHASEGLTCDREAGRMQTDLQTSLLQSIRKYPATYMNTIQSPAYTRGQVVIVVR